MSTTAFLAGLPAILAITGFVIYRLSLQGRRSQEITKDIISKLRQQSPGSAASIEGLSPRAVAERLAHDAALREQVNAQDFELLKVVSRQEFIVSIVAYALMATLFCVGVGAFVYVQTRERGVAITNWHLQSQDPAAAGLAVDTDDLVLTWTADGPPTDMTVLLENIDSGRRTEERRVSTAQQSLKWPKESYEELLSVRTLRGSNRIRAIGRAPKASFTSNEFALHVGIRVVAIPVDEDSAIWVSAMIDNSSIQNYVFDAKLIVWPRGATTPRSFGDKMRNPKTVFRTGPIDSLNLTSLKIAYFGPDDARVVRTGLLQ